MHIRLLAVGQRQPAWVEEAFREYAARLPRQWQFKLLPLATGQRSKVGGPDNAVASEGKKLLGQLRPSDNVVLLDESGKQYSSIELADRLADWQGDGRDVVFIIGGPDGVSEDCRARADHTWSLSRLTLPHGLARVMFAEQLYRAWTIGKGHPYHRE
jgi:23S rRNA (pseudouridine1915-N3)-methyltransferase